MKRYSTAILLIIAFTFSLLNFSNAQELDVGLRVQEIDITNLFDVVNAAKALSFTSYQPAWGVQNAWVRLEPTSIDFLDATDRIKISVNMYTGADFQVGPFGWDLNWNGTLEIRSEVKTDFDPANGKTVIIIEAFDHVNVTGSPIDWVSSLLVNDFKNLVPTQKITFNQEIFEGLPTQHFTSSTPIPFITDTHAGAGWGLKGLILHVVNYVYGQSGNSMVEINGTDYSLPISLEIPPGTNITMTADKFANINGNYYKFTQWSDGVTTLSRSSIVYNNDMSLVVYYPTPVLFVAPGNFVAESAVLSADLSWTLDPNADSYKIYKSSSPGGPFSQIANTTNTEYKDILSDLNTYYYYAVAIYDGIVGPATQTMSVQSLHMASRNINATALNTGRRMARGNDGSYHLVYEDGGDIFYTNSLNNGVSWSLETLVSDGEGRNRNPSIAHDRFGDNDNYTIIWEEYDESNLEIVVFFRRLDGSFGNWSNIELVYYFTAPSSGHRAAPVIAGNSMRFTAPAFVSVYDDGSTLLLGVSSWGGEGSIPYINLLQNVAGAFAGAQYPSIDYHRHNTQDDHEFAVAWQGGGNDIWFRPGELDLLDPQFPVITWNSQSKINNGFMLYEDNYKPSYTREGNPPNGNRYLAWWGDYTEIESPPLFKSLSKITGQGTLRKSIFFRKKIGAGSWSTLVEFQHGSHYETDPSIASYTNNGDLIIVWKCASHLAAVKYSNGSWGSIIDFNNSGNYPNLNSGSTESRIVWADPPTPYDILTSSTDFIPMNKTTSAANASGLIKKRKGYINLAPGDTTKDAIRPELFFEMSEPELLLSSKRREKAKFHPDNRVQNPDWLSTDLFAIPADADSVLLAYKFVVRNIGPDLIARLKSKSNILQLKLQNITNKARSISIKTLKAEDLSAARDSLFIIKELVRFSAKSLRGDKTRFTVNLYGKDKGIIPAYTEVYHYPVMNDSLAKSAGKYAVRDLTSEIIPGDYSLSRNYPNPFNPVTRIDFALPEAGRTRIIIYDLLGKEVIRLVDSEMPEGYHTVSWNASIVASGIYFYSLSSGKFIDTKKMLLLK